MDEEPALLVEVVPAPDEDVVSVVEDEDSDGEVDVSEEELVVEGTVVDAEAESEELGAGLEFEFELGRKVFESGLAALYVTMTVTSFAPFVPTVVAQLL